MKRVVRGLVLSSALVASCATISVKKDLVVERAVFDLECQEPIDVVELGNGKVFGAAGCGRKASYVVICRTAEASSCAAILNSEELPAQRPQGGANPGQSRPEAESVRYSESEAPLGAGGIEFGQTADSIGAACEGSGYRWKRANDVAACGGLIKASGYQGRTRVKLCNELACEIRLGLELGDSNNAELLLTEYGKLHASLGKLYGEPTAKTIRLSGRCSNELVACLKEGAATLRSTWRWRSGVTLQFEMVEQDGEVKAYLEYASQRQEISGL